MSSSLVETVTDHYLIAGLWADTIHEDGEPCEDECWELVDIVPETRAEAEEAVSRFLDAARVYADMICYVESYPEQSGHDLWLSANHHGAGFWDRGLGELGDRLHAAAQTIGSAHILVGPEGPAYVNG
jgi:hypothetical protein